MEVDEILRSQKFQELLDVLETDEVDFKDQPYFVDTDRQKYDLAEDITAFANHEGGVLVLGCRTTPVPDLEGDVVTDVRPFSQDLCKFEVWRSVCNTLIYPPIKGLKFLFHELPDDPNRGLVSIVIPKSSEADRPHLLAHVLNEGTDRKVTTKYGLVIRTGARNSAYLVQNIHALIQSGSAISKVERSLESIEQKLAAILQKDQNINDSRLEFSRVANKRKFLEKVPAFLESVGRDGSPTLLLGAYPSKAIVVNEIYDGASLVSTTFDKPPELRENGFGLSIQNPSELIDGVARRARGGFRKARQLSNSGKLLVSVSADENFLAWATNRRPGYPLRYRSYVLAEVTYIFARYVRDLYDAIVDKPKYLDILVALRNCFVDDLPPQLGVAADHGHFHHHWIDPKPAPKVNMLTSVRVPVDISAERLAFETRACLYRRFGFGDDQIPYSTLGEEGRITTAENILDLSQR
jgi:Putative DNA-binding domain